MTENCACKPIIAVNEVFAEIVQSKGVVDL